MRAILSILFSVCLIPALPAGVLPPDAVVGGKSIGEWSAECWKWIYSIPTNQNPQLDCDSGEWAAYRQPDSTVFMVAPLNGKVSGACLRTFSVPTGRYILMPMLVLTIDNIGVDPPKSIPDMYIDIDAVLDPPADLHATIDGVPVPNLEQYRGTSPPFSFDFPDSDNTLSFYYEGPVVGLVDPIISDGYWLMIEPLSPGEHLIRAGGATVLPNFLPHDILCRITVVANQVPVADASATFVRVIAPDANGAVVRLDGSRSSDPNQDGLTYQWTEAGALLATGVTAERPLSLGVHSIRLMVSDGQVSAETTIEVRVLTPGEALQGLVEAMLTAGLATGDRQSLTGIALAAQRSLYRGAALVGARQLQVLHDQIGRRLHVRNPALTLSWQSAVAEILAVIRSPK